MTDIGVAQYEAAKRAVREWNLIRYRHDRPELPYSLSDALDNLRYKMDKPMKSDHKQVLQDRLIEAEEDLAELVTHWRQINFGFTLGLALLGGALFTTATRATEYLTVPLWILGGLFTIVAFICMAFCKSDGKYSKAKARRKVRSAQRALEAHQEEALAEMLKDMP